MIAFNERCHTAQVEAKEKERESHPGLFFVRFKGNSILTKNAETRIFVGTGSIATDSQPTIDM